MSYKQSYKKLKYKLGRGSIKGSWIQGRQAVRSRRVHSRRNHTSVRTFRDRLGDDHIVSVSHLLVTRMNRVNDLITDGVVPSKRQQDYVVYYDLGQVEVKINSSLLLQAILEPFTIIDATSIKERLRNLKLYHGVGSGSLHLLTKSNQLRR